MNPEDTTPSGTRPRLEDWESESSGPSIDYEPEAVAFIDSVDLRDERARAEGILQSMFSAADRMTVSLEYDAEEEDAPPSVVVHIATGARFAEFRHARKRAYRKLLRAGCRRLYQHLAMVRA